MADIEGLRGEEKPQKCRRTARIYSKISTCNYTRRLEGCLHTGNKFMDNEIIWIHNRLNETPSFLYIFC